jgi:hypothetical protein
MVVVYEMGYSESFIDYSLLTDVHKGKIVLRRFKYENYPEWFRIDKFAGQYSWKPIIIKELVDEFGKVLWLDAGNVIEKENNLSAIVDVLGTTGFYSPISVGSPLNWTHPLMWAYFGVAKNSILQWASVPNCNGAVVGFGRGTPAYSRVLLPWHDCAMNLDCIAPPGSDRSNHRQDQAALTILSHQNGFVCYPFCKESCGGILLHQDYKVASRQRCKRLGLKKRLGDNSRVLKAALVGKHQEK